VHIGEGGAGAIGRGTDHREFSRTLEFSLGLRRDCQSREIMSGRSGISRRQALQITAALGGLAMASSVNSPARKGPLASSS
jgi:hypothetical protein